MAKKTVKKQAEKTLKKAKYRSFKLEKRIKHDASGMPSIWANARASVAFLLLHYKIFGGMLAVHFAVYFVFFRTNADFSIGELQELLNLLFEDAGSVRSQLAVASEAFSIKINDLSAQNPFAVLGLNILSSLALIWAIRHKHANKKFRLKDPYYNGMHPLMPFSLLVVVIVIQLLPFTIGATLFGSVTNSVTTTGAEQAVLLVLWMALGTVSAYWLTVSGLALYAVTLEGVAPFEALDGIKERLEYRRLAAFVRIAGFVAVLALLVFAGLLGVIYIASGLAFLYIDIMLVFLPFLLHTYVYKLYKAIL